MINLTQDILDQSGAISAWDKIKAIQDFLVNGNETISFLRNHYGSGRPDGMGSDSDISHWILNSSREGNCDEFTSVFVTMLRIAGMPARKVTGFAGGTGMARPSTCMGRTSRDGRKCIFRQIRTKENWIWVGSRSRLVPRCRK